MLCNVCGNVTFSTTTCALCSMGKLPLDKSIEQLAQEHGDRHRPPNPGAYPELWFEVIQTKRVADLFRTLPGLPGHWTQIQSAVNSTTGKPSFYKDGSTTDLGKTIYRMLAKSIIHAAEEASFDFNQQVLTFTPDLRYLKIQRKGKLIIASRP